MTLEDLESDQELIECEYKFDGETKESFGLCKATDINEEERSVVAVISSNAVDRDKEVLVPGGIEMENFQKNPVIPWSHQTFDPPIGKALWVSKVPKRNTRSIRAKVKFATTERAEEVWQLFKGGFLNAFSVGFIPKEGRRPTPEDVKANPLLAEVNFMFTKWELTEFSPVTVPANPEALALAVKNKSIRLSDELKQCLHVEEVKDVEEDEIFLCADDFKEKAISVEIPVEEFIEVDIM
jgi:HK97 family phage prohead protease